LDAKPADFGSGAICGMKVRVLVPAAGGVAGAGPMIVAVRPVGGNTDRVIRSISSVKRRDCRSGSWEPCAVGGQ